jgi:hypothetical protein
MYGRAASGHTLKDSVLAIPRAALVGSVKNPQVFVVENNQAILKDIQVGTDAQGTIEVLSGLTEGQQVVTSGQINLENKSKVQVVK